MKDEGTRTQDNTRAIVQRGVTPRPAGRNVDTPHDRLSIARHNGDGDGGGVVGVEVVRRALQNDKFGSYPLPG
eukprot:2034927-Prymnesium_polylepis.1